MRIVFVTHNDLGLACLEELVRLGADVQAVYTRPKRDDISDQTDFDSFATEHGVPLHHVESVNSEEVKQQMREYDPELTFVIGWSQLVSQDVIEIPSKAALGMHPAPLPRGRGRAPIAWTLIKGLEQTALSMFHLVAEADAGDLVGQRTIEVDRTDDAASLYEKVNAAGPKLVESSYHEFASGNVPRKPQDHSAATWWPKREPHHGLVDWTRTPMEVYNWIRGQTRPYPGAYSLLDGRKVTFWALNPPTDKRVFVAPGEIAYVDGDAVAIGAWEGYVEVTELQVGDDEPVQGCSLTAEYEFEVGDTFINARDKLR